MVSPSTFENLHDKTMKTGSSYGKVKSVTGRLVDTWTKLTNTESNIYLFSELIRLGISTNDVHAFLKNQAKLRRINTNLDPPMSKSAMKAKLSDAVSFLNRLKQSVAKALKYTLIPHMQEKICIVF